MPDGFSLTDEQKRAFNEILSGAPASNKSGLGSVEAKREPRFDVFNDTIGSGKILTEIKSKLPLSFVGTAVIECDPVNSKEVVVALTKFTQQAKVIPVIVLMNYNYKTVMGALAAENIKDGFIIIDTVSKSISKVNESSQLVFVDSIRNLTQLQIKMLNLIEEHKYLTFIFDSVGMLSLYHEEDIVLKFIYSATKIIHKNNCSGLFVSAGAISASMLQFFDEDIKLKKFM
jgi:hypothetical protein